MLSKTHCEHINKMLKLLKSFQ